MIAIPHPLAAAARSRPDHPALIVGGSGDQGSSSYGSLADEVARRAQSLRDLGVGVGDVVALDGAPDADWVAAFHAIGWLGAVAAPLPTDEVERARAAPLVGANHTITPTRLPLADSGCEPAAWPLDAPRLVVLTSGSTGTPRRVELSTGQLVFSALGSAMRLGHDPADSWLCCLPLHHVGGLSILLRCAIYGTTVRLHPRFDASEVAHALDAGDASLVSLVPTMLRRVLDDRGARPFPARLRVVLLGGGPIPGDLLERAAGLKVPVARTWGMTEAASQIATAPPGDDAPGYPPLPFVQVRATGDGALVVEGPIAPGGRLVTADTGRVDPTGRVHVAGRRDDVIISGGENVDPREVETVLEAHPAIREAAVVGIPDAEWGARPMALVVVDGPVDDAALRAHCTARLSRFRVPDRFARVPGPLPRSALGKLRRGAVARLAEDAGAPKAVDQIGGHVAGREVRPIDGGMHQPHDRTRDAVGAVDIGPDGERPPPDALDARPDDQVLAHAHGRLEVGLRVDEGRGPGRPAERAVEPGRLDLEDRAQQLFERRVGVFEDPAEEQDSGAIDLVEADGDAVLEGHLRAPDAAGGRTRTK
jgi:O-succinylbenzoic acid--CoA ligase